MYKEFSTKGKHIFVDAYGIKPEFLDDIGYLKHIGKNAIFQSGATLVDIVEKKFDPYGCTVLFLLEESHLSFHTFVESLDKKDNTYISIDLYTCGDADTDVGIKYILEQLKPEPNRIYRQTVIRGVE